MLDRISVTVALNTIIAVLAKMAFLDSKVGFFTIDNFRWHDTTVLIVAIFMIFFRGKMMHDDHQYFTDIEKGRYKNAEGADIWWNKIGLFLGYLSWIVWAPAIYFMGTDWIWFGSFMAASVALSMIWACIDAEQIPKIKSPRNKTPPDKWLIQHSWVIFNIFYYVGFILIAGSANNNPKLAFVGASLLLVVLMIDWFLSKPIATTIEAAD